jgi:hypothetical protein
MRDPRLGEALVLDAAIGAPELGARAWVREHVHLALVQEWSAAAEEGTPLEASMQPAIECIAQFSAVGLPPALPGM